MSTNRNKAEDVFKTAQLLKSKISKDNEGNNWLGHRLHSGAERLDDMLLKGATMAEMEAVRGSVNSHLFHLKADHGLETVLKGDKYYFSLCDKVK